MNPIKLYKWSLTLPLVVPILFAPTLLLLRNTTETIAIVVLSIVYSGIVGGIPYLILAIVLFRWMKEKNELQIRKKLLQSPLLMLGVFIACFTLIHLFFFILSMGREINEQITQFTVGLIFCSALILIFGYFYIFLTFGIVHIFRKS